MLGRPQLEIGRARVIEIIDLIKSRACHVAPTQQIEATADPGDNVFLECADQARADYVVTANKRHFPKFWKSTMVVNARELLTLIAPHLLRRND